MWCVLALSLSCSLSFLFSFPFAFPFFSLLSLFFSLLFLFLFLLLLLLLLLLLFLFFFSLLFSPPTLKEPINQHGAQHGCDLARASASDFCQSPPLLSLLPHPTFYYRNIWLIFNYDKKSPRVKLLLPKQWAKRLPSCGAVRVAGTGSQVSRGVVDEEWTDVLSAAPHDVSSILS